MSESFQDLENWLSQFRQSHGRNLRVLHIGNIAANGYLNAKFLRRYNVEADVLCYDYYHIMAYPEWEDLAINRPFKSQIKPIFSKLDTGKYNRPKWFVQGPLILCLNYLLAKNNAQPKIAKKVWRDLEKHLNRHWMPSLKLILQRKVIIRLLKLIEKKNSKTLVLCLNFFRFPNFFIKSLRLNYYKLKRLCGFMIYKLGYLDDENNDFFKNLNLRYKYQFPKRKFHFIKDQISPYLVYKKYWKELFNYYDIIQCYGTDPIYASLLSDKPYIGFEHGTLRTYTSDNSVLHALTSLAYKEAKHVFITNGDCLEHALKLDIHNYSPMIHPIDIEQHRNCNEKYIEVLRKSFATDILLFCPLRHDWSVKGTDLHIRMLKKLKDKLIKKITLVMINWGGDIIKSKRLADDLGVSSMIKWISPVSRVNMIKYMHASDVVLDQTILPCFGSTSPQALACGTPTIMSYIPESTCWLIEEAAPIITAATIDEIIDGILLTQDEQWLAEFKVKAKNWIDKYHSPKVAVEKQLQVYKQILEETL